ncbi:hypothetical protein, partial [Neobacillus drentensis]|uniref:hypothetical protein n=1 Tax=Neobacillus drentensis TaxID=220684 RepID=UPI00300219C3
MLAIVSWCLLPASASAHFEPIGYSDVEVKDENVLYSLFLDPYQLQSYVDLDGNTNGYIEENEVAENKEQLIQYVQSKLVLTTDTEELQPEFGEIL